MSTADSGERPRIGRGWGLGEGWPRVPVCLHTDAEVLEESGRAQAGVLLLAWGDGPLSSRNREMSELCKWNKA